MFFGEAIMNWKGKTKIVTLLWPATKMAGNLSLTQKLIQHGRLSGLFVLFILGLAPDLKSQGLILNDKMAIDSIKKGIEYIYNFQFDKSEAAVRKVKQKYQGHPALLLYSSVQEFWQFFPINGSKQFAAYQKNLLACIAESEKMALKYPKQPEVEFFNMMANLLLARHLSEDGEYIKAVNHTRKAYTFIKRGFEYKNQYAEFYFSTGLYNYYREAFPENHPMYKPFTIFFPNGNKSLGLKELEIASQKALFARPEALGFLTGIYLRDEYNLPVATKYATQLYESYPGNWLYSVLYGECMAETKKPDLAENIADRLMGRNENCALLGGYYIKGLVERQRGNVDAAKWSFQKALQYGKTKDRLTKGYMGLCYNELGKIARAEGKMDWAKKYFGLALENCSFKKVKQDAKANGF